MPALPPPLEHAPVVRLHKLTCARLAIFTCTGCLLATTNFHHPSSQFSSVHYTTVPPFHHPWEVLPVPTIAFKHSLSLHFPMRLLTILFPLSQSLTRSNALCELLPQPIHPCPEDSWLHCLHYPHLTRVYSSLCSVYYFPSILPLFFMLKVTKHTSLKTKHLAVSVLESRFLCESSTFLFKLRDPSASQSSHIRRLLTMHVRCSGALSKEKFPKISINI